MTVEPTNVIDATMDDLKRFDRDEVFHTWGRQTGYVSEVIVRAEGCYYWTDTGRKVLDFASQMNYCNIGHGDQRVAAAIAKQAGELATIYGSAKVPTIRLAHTMLSLLPDSYGRVFFGSNGSDAVEAALKIARLTTGRPNIVSFAGGYHGSHVGGAAVSGIASVRSGSVPSLPGNIIALPPNHYRSALAGATPEETELRTVQHLRQLIYAAGPETVAAVIAEPVLGSGGGVIPGKGFWAQVRAACDELGVLLIADEVVTGFGRLGHWFARDYYDFEPDMICLAKGLTSGYLPLSAVVFRSDFSERFEGVSLPHGLTYSGHAVCCAAALANISVIEEDGLVENARKVGTYLADRLSGLYGNHLCVGDVRALGMFGILELVQDRSSKALFQAGVISGTDAQDFVAEYMDDRGIKVVALRADGLIGIFPPLIASRAQVDACVDVLDEALTVVDRYVDSA